MWVNRPPPETSLPPSPSSRHGAFRRRAPRTPACGCEAGGRGDVRLDADDRLDVAEALGDLVELVRPEHVAVVAHRDGRHALAVHLGEHGLELRAPSSIEYSV